MDVLRFFDMLCPVAEQVIDVPKISLGGHPCATLVSRASAGGTVGGSADGRILFFVIAANCGAAR